MKTLRECNSIIARLFEHITPISTNTGGASWSMQDDDHCSARMAMRQMNFCNSDIFVVLITEERPVGGDTTLALEVYNDRADALLAGTVGFGVTSKKSNLCVVGVFGSRRYGKYQVMIGSDPACHSDNPEVLHLKKQLKRSIGQFIRTC